MKWKIRVGMLVFLIMCTITGCQGAGKWNHYEQEEVQSLKEIVDKEQKEAGKTNHGKADEKKNAEETVIPEEALPKPLSGLYPDMVVARMEYVPLKADKKVVYITFDDGPCKSTPELLEVLKKLNVKVTFFVTAQYGSDEEIVEWLKQIKAEGHAIGVHSFSHRYKEIYSSVKSYLKDFKKMDDLIVRATGEHARMFRFPGGSNTDYNASVREDIIKEMTSRGMVYYDWNAYNGDCDGFSKSKMIAKAVRESSYRNKSIVLMHNIPKKEQVLEVLPEIIGRLRSKDYVFEPIDGTVEPIQFIKEKDVVKKS